MTKAPAKKEELITIDGSLGEGGGQILRTALALSIVSGRPFRIEKLRAGRAKPGLLRQHLTGLNAATAISAAGVQGAALGSREATFSPGKVKPGDYTFAVGSAGSATLVLQTVLPALLGADGPSTLTLEGGTHNPHAPPFDFVEQAFLPLLNRMGPAVYGSLERAGFYPAGGGRFFVGVTPPAAWTPLRLPVRGAIIRREARACVAGLPGEIAERELARVEASLNWTGEQLKTRQLPDDQGPGNVLMLQVTSEHVTELFTAFGSRGVSAEAVAEAAAFEARAYLAADVPVGPHLADQLLIPMALAATSGAGASSFVTQTLTEHTRTNATVISRFLPVSFSTEELGRDRWKVSVERMT